jgi:hypothetical protein
MSQPPGDQMLDFSMVATSAWPTGAEIAGGAGETGPEIIARRAFIQDESKHYLDASRSERNNPWRALFLCVTVADLPSSSFE